MKNSNLVEGNIFKSLMKFAIPVLGALFLQALYGGVDLFIVGRFAETADVSGVATGSMFLHTVTSVVTGMTMGITVFVGQSIGEKNREKTNKGIGSGIFLFIIIARAENGSSDTDHRTALGNGVSVIIAHAHR